MTREVRSITASMVLTRGSARQMAQVFKAGKAVAPFSVGSHGDWCVAGAGVEPQHFYLYFDGHALFAATAADGPVTSIGRKRIIARWTQLPDGGVLTFGAASMAVTNLGQRGTPPPPSPAARVDPRGPRIVDPFACETLVYLRPSPLALDPGEPSDAATLVRPRLETLTATGARGEALEDATLVRPRVEKLKAVGALAEPLEEPTVVHRPWAREFARKPVVRAVDASLAKTIARPVMAPLAVTLATPVPSVVTRPSRPVAGRPTGASRSAAKPTISAPTLSAQRLLLRKCIAGLLVAALVLMGVRALSRRPPTLPVKAVVAPVSASSAAVTAASGSPSPRASGTVGEPQNPDVNPLPIVNGKTAERQAVDLVARGAFSEAAALYDRLARRSDVPTFREAARIARRKARLAK